MGENHLFAVQSLANLEPTKIKYRIDNAFHMLRHFERVDEQLQANLLRAGHVEKAIQGALTLPGSRFFANFASASSSRALSSLTAFINGNTNISFDTPCKPSDSR
jgi:hypothetical protein